MGYLLDGSRIRIPEERVRGYTEVTTPKNRLSLRKYLNSLAYFRSNIPGFSELVAPLEYLVTHSDPGRIGHKKYEWMELHQQAFERLKVAVKTHLPLEPIDCGRGVEIHTDASRNALSFVAFQRNEDGKIAFLACQSRRLTKTEKEYSMFRLELIALIFGLVSLRNLLLFSTITAYIDAKSLENMKNCRARMRCMLDMLCF